MTVGFSGYAPAKFRCFHSATPVTSLKLDGVPDFTIQNSEFRIQKLQELKNLGFRQRFSQGDACPGFSDKDLARIFCNSCNF
jgi:hypothetical protein